MTDVEPEFQSAESIHTFFLELARLHTLSRSRQAQIDRLTKETSLLKQATQEVSEEALVARCTRCQCEAEFLQMRVDVVSLERSIQSATEETRLAYSHRDMFLRQEQELNGLAAAVQSCLHLEQRDSVAPTVPGIPSDFSETPETREDFMRFMASVGLHSSTPLPDILEQIASKMEHLQRLWANRPILQSKSEKSITTSDTVQSIMDDSSMPTGCRLTLVEKQVIHYLAGRGRGDVNHQPIVSYH